MSDSQFYFEEEDDDFEEFDPMANDPSDEVKEAMNTVLLPGSWDIDREGQIITGIEGNFGGYPLTASTAQEQLAAWKVLAEHFGVDE